MSIGELVAAAFQDPNMFWSAVGAMAQAVEAIVVLVSAVVIVFQIRRMKQESLRDRISGLYSALEVIGSDLLQKVLAEIPQGAEIRGVNWDALLDQLDLVALLIERGYTDEKLFLDLKGDELRLLRDYLEKFSYSIPERHWRAKRLLERARASGQSG